MFHVINALFHKNHATPAALEEKTAYTIEEVRCLRKWEENLHKRESACAQKTKEIEKHRQQQEACYQELKSFSQQMDVRQAELDLYQKQLDSREEALTLQRNSLETAITRYCHERALWQQLNFQPVHPALDGHVDQLRQDFRAVRNDLSEAQNALVGLMDHVQRIQNQGIEEICWLHQDAVAVPTEESQRFAARLSVILRESFGAEPIDPTPGSQFDSSLYECGSGSGSTVTACIHSGWQWNGGIFRAVVALR